MNLTPFGLKSTPSVPLLPERRGRKREEGLTPLLDAPLGSGDKLRDKQIMSRGQEQVGKDEKKNYNILPYSVSR